METAEAMLLDTEEQELWQAQHVEARTALVNKKQLNMEANNKAGRVAEGGMQRYVTQQTKG